MKPEALQKLMRHKAYHTTLGYVDMAKQVTDAVDKLNVPDVLQSGPKKKRSRDTPKGQ